MGSTGPNYPSQFLYASPRSSAFRNAVILKTLSPFRICSHDSPGANGSANIRASDF